MRIDRNVCEPRAPLWLIERWEGPDHRDISGVKVLGCETARQTAVASGFDRLVIDSSISIFGCPASPARLPL
jgi:hypothetical protein